MDGKSFKKHAKTFPYSKTTIEKGERKQSGKIGRERELAKLE